MLQQTNTPKRDMPIRNSVKMLHVIMLCADLAHEVQHKTKLLLVIFPFRN